ncbi:MAG: T9SS type A sorting domain-containing protein [Bacteroidetes bacterium]|nr:T9SS type A sorting domain-containing protein [Bacteroidota bacterium]
MKHIKLLLITGFILTGTYYIGNGQGFICGDIITDSRDGQVYPTVQIGAQCWMKQNLNIGLFVFGTSSGYPNSNVSNNGIIEKYCYNNMMNNCKTYGGLYDWDEAMNYTTAQGTQGICPAGWHIPTESEWYELEHFIDPTINPNSYGWRGTNCGTKLKQGGSSGFDALFGGLRNYDGVFNYMGSFGWFWTSTESFGDYVFKRSVGSSYASIWRDESIHSYGFSIRCITYDGVISQIPQIPENLIQTHVYPNPASNNLTLEIPNENTTFHFEIFNIAGEAVYKSDVNKTVVIDISDFPNGAYWIKLYNDKSIRIVPFHKE